MRALLFGTIPQSLCLAGGTNSLKRLQIGCPGLNCPILQTKFLLKCFQVSRGWGLGSFWSSGSKFQGEQNLASVLPPQCPLCFAACGMTFHKKKGSGKCYLSSIFMLECLFCNYFCKNHHHPLGRAISGSNGRKAGGLGWFWEASSACPVCFKLLKKSYLIF